MRIKHLLMALTLSAGLIVFSNSEVEALRYFAQTPQMTSSTTPYGDNSQAAHYAKSGDAKIYYEVYGQGDPVVILHGGGLGSAY